MRLARMLRIAFFVALAALMGCTASASPDAGLNPDAASNDTGPDGNGGDAFALQDVGGCHVQVTTTPRTTCNEDCTARLLLVSGASFCTFQCSSQDECTPYGLDCVSDVGACMPRCMTDEDCPAGFYRCDPVAHFCDSYPTGG